MFSVFLGQHTWDFSMRSTMDILSHCLAAQSNRPSPVGASQLPVVIFLKSETILWLHHSLMRPSFTHETILWLIIHWWESLRDSAQPSESGQHGGLVWPTGSFHEKWTDEPVLGAFIPSGVFVIDFTLAPAARYTDGSESSSRWLSFHASPALTCQWLWEGCSVLRFPFWHCLYLIWKSEHSRKKRENYHLLGLAYRFLTFLSFFFFPTGGEGGLLWR
jgi:hypothetical protein